MNKGALVLGSRVAGIQAALDLADSGISVQWVEPSPFLGGGSGTDGSSGETVPDHVLNARMLQAAKHPQVTLWTRTTIEEVGGEAGRFRVELNQRPRFVDTSRCTACGDCIEACPVTVPGTEQKAIFLPNKGQPDCAAIIKEGQAPCAHACPGGIHVQGYIALIAQGRFQEAIDLIREAIPFPAICGRICTHPCEVDCSRAEVDGPVSIRLLKRFVSDWELENGEPRRAGSKTGTRSAQPGRVAVVGAGPGGMTAASRLARMGHQVTVFEKLPVIGGMMAVGIPEYRLPREVIAREYQEILDLGVEVRLNTAIGPDGKDSVAGLFERGYQAVLLAVGAHKSRALRIQGEELGGVVHGIDLLREISLAQQLDGGGGLQQTLGLDHDTRVAVLGGGNTAMDVSRSLRRLGLQDVRILYRRTRSEMPAMEEEIEDAELEGIGLEYLVSPLRVAGNEQGKVVGLQCQRMKLGEPDDSGRRRPLPIEGSTFTVDVDMVVLAIGQAPDLGFLGQGHGINITVGERIQVDGALMTSRPGVFAAGDAITWDKMAVIEAIGMGKQAALAIDAYLCNRPPNQVLNPGPDQPVARREMSEAELSAKARIKVPSLPLRERVAGYAEVELGYRAQEAVAEAQRCLVCGPCSECQACVHVCEPQAVNHGAQAVRATVDIGAIIHAAGDLEPDPLPVAASKGLYRVPPLDPLMASSAAAQAMADLFAERRPPPAAPIRVGRTDPVRIGVFVCECGDEIAKVVNTRLVSERAGMWPHVFHSQTLPFSCTPDAASLIQDAVEAHDLSRVVLAACSCCSFDQVCYGCTYQRLRCKDNLGMFGPLGGEDTLYEFANIREQCAWPHAGDPVAATAKATALVAAAVAKVRMAEPRIVDWQPAGGNVLILGSGQAAQTCHQALATQAIASQRVEGLPGAIERVDGTYIVRQNGTSWQAGAVILAPDAGEAPALLALIGDGSERAAVSHGATTTDTHRPGILFCDPSLDRDLAGKAVAARAAAWLGRAPASVEPTKAVVDAARCRACSTCTTICELGAARLVGEEPQRHSWIDPAICSGCGTCAAHCPSGAITAGYSTDAQLEAMLDALLAPGEAP